jgi:NAD(P)H-nitrite reductase large subunit
LRHGSGHYDGLGVRLQQGRVSTVDPANRSLTLADGSSMSYDRLLVATGSHTTRPPIPGMDLPGVENCWTLQDARHIAERARPGSKVVLLGAGFIGCIVLEALVARKVQLTVVELEDRMLPRMMDPTGAELLKSWCERQGVRTLTNTRVTAVESAGEALRLSLDGGPSLDADLVVCATGVRPNLDLVAGSGVATDVGILVDHHLETTVPGIYAAGDVAQGPVFGSSKQEVHAIQPTASEHGQIAGHNMAGHQTRYHGSLSMNVLNTLGLVSSSFGAWDGVPGGDRAQTLDRESSQYLRLEFQDDRLVGAIALGLTQHVGVIRGLIQNGIDLGAWKDRLMHDPHQVMSAYLECTRASAAA